MKKTLFVALMMLLVTWFTACAPAQSADPEGGAKGKKVAGVVFFEDQFMKLLQSGYKDAAEAAGYEFYPGNTNNDAAKEVEMLNTYVTQGYAGVAIAPTSGTSSIEPLTKAADSGLVVGVANSSLDNNDWMSDASPRTIISWDR